MDRLMYNTIWEYVVFRKERYKSERAESNLYNEIVESGVIPVPKEKDDVQEILECISSAIKYGKKECVK